MLIREDLGEARTSQKITPGNTATSIGANIYEYTERTVDYTSGGTSVMAVGDTVVGATSAASGIIVARTITSGTDAAGTAAGVLTLRCQVGAFQSENLNRDAASNIATIAADSVPKPASEQAFPRQRAKSALISVEDNSIYFSIDGAIPTQTSKMGHKLTAGQSYLVSNPDAIKRIQVIDAVAGSAGVVKITCFF